MIAAAELRMAEEVAADFMGSIVATMETRTSREEAEVAPDAAGEEGPSLNNKVKEEPQRAAEITQIPSTQLSFIRATSGTRAQGRQEGRALTSWLVKHMRMFLKRLLRIKQ